MYLLKSPQIFESVIMHFMHETDISTKKKSLIIK